MSKKYAILLAIGGLIVGTPVLVWSRGTYPAKPAAVAFTDQPGPPATAARTLTWQDLIQQEQTEWARLRPVIQPFQPVMGVQTQITEADRRPLKIVFFGDSMVETLGDLEPWAGTLSTALNRPTEAVNLGVGAQTIRLAYERISAPTGADRQQPSLISLRPDMVIVESFVYNPMPQHEYDQWLDRTVARLRELSVRIYFLVTIAPDCAVFGNGPGGVDWEKEVKADQCRTIRELARHAIRRGEELDLAVIDVFSSSREANGEGRPELIDRQDGIHPSAEGKKMILAAVADRLKDDILNHSEEAKND